MTLSVQMDEDRELRSLKALAEACDGREWFEAGISDCGLTLVDDGAEAMFPIAAETKEARFIIKANPKTILSLISALEEAREGKRNFAEEVAKLRKVIGPGWPQAKHWQARAEAAEAALAGLSNAVAALSEFENGKTLFEADVIESAEAMTAWRMLDLAQKEALSKLASASGNPSNHNPDTAEHGGAS